MQLATPLETAGGTISEREGFLVRIETDELSGIGEATPLPGWTESVDACHEALTRAETIAEELDWGIALARTESVAARHGLSLALADAHAKKNGIALYRTLGQSEHVQSVPVNATLGAAKPDVLAGRAESAVEDGYRTIKLKIGTDGVEEDVERVRAVRNAVGPDVDIRVDVNGAWTSEKARRAIDGLATLDVSLVEQPLPAAQLEAHATLRNQGVDIALDESLIAHDVAEIIEKGAADVLVLKPMVLGGPDRAFEAAMDCSRAGIEPLVSTTIDAVVARVGAVHVAAAIPDPRPAGIATADMLATDLAPDPAPVEAGEITVPQGSGLGFPSTDQP